MIITYIYYDEYITMLMTDTMMSTMRLMIITDNNTSWDDDEDNNDDAFSCSGTTAIIN